MGGDIGTGAPHSVGGVWEVSSGDGGGASITGRFQRIKLGDKWMLRDCYNSGGVAELTMRVGQGSRGNKNPRRCHSRNMSEKKGASS